MGKLNKKLPKPKLFLKPGDDSNKVKGPFPIYRTTPVLLNGPETTSFKIIESKPKKDSGTKSSPPPPADKSPKKADKLPADVPEQDEGVKTKKLRKLAISRLSKKEKKQFRKEEMLKKVELTKQAFKQDKDRKKREQTAITGDLKPLLDALPSLESLFEVKSAAALKTGVPKYDKKAEPKTRKQRQTERRNQSKREFMKRCRTMKRVLNDKAFKQDPKKMVAAHIKNVRKEQVERLMKSVS
ncbi:ribosome biogenesis protein SLX9 homolog [Anopheles maculipalpis]|uniref:ribosome biogenesis protein SLX9 homolog n=1 Tax=Anopheles maculipalpis TaxID=1496333 RepID=UPI002158A222|nr:ribosome biogenesis protein SLX9 homolog [Anopheles maculipalpis]